MAPAPTNSIPRRLATSAADDLAAYGRLIEGARDKVILHWLGDMFDPQPAGYWGSNDVPTLMQTALDLIGAHKDKVEGIKISLLHQTREDTMQARLPPGVWMYAGDDVNVAATIEGDGQRHSHGLLGIFDPMAPAAAFARLAQGDVAGYRDTWNRPCRCRAAFTKPLPHTRRPGSYSCLG